MVDNVTTLPLADAEHYTVGDVVRLNSGGPECTVVRLSGKGKNEIAVAWFDDGKALTEAIFPAGALRFVEQTKVGK